MTRHGPATKAGSPAAPREAAHSGAPRAAARDRLRARTAASAALLVVASTMVACGSGSSHSAGPNASCPAGIPGVTPNSIKIGLVLPDTGGPVAEAFRPARGAVDARIAKQNAAGGVNGRQIDVTWQDDEGDAGVFTHAVQTLVQTDQVFGLIAQTVNLTDQSASWLQQAGVPVTGLPTSPIWSNYSNVFHLGSLFNKGGAVDTYGRYIKAQGGTKALIVIDPSAPTSANLADQMAPSLRSQGITVVGQTSYSENSSNPAKVATQLRQEGADTLVGAVQADAFIDIYAAARAANVNLKVALSSSDYGPAQIKQRGKAMAGMSMTMAFQSYTSNSPAIKAYQEAMTTYSPETESPFDDLAIVSYAAADEMIKGLELAGACPTRQSFITNLRKVTSYDAGGLLAPTNLSKPHDPVSCFNFLKVSASGDSFATVPGNSPSGFWCGDPVPASASGS
ncbi:ABC transporter substrate-binding protein [Frankia sp. AgB1.9]|uniref:ABC transporter substrate-binding protein n=1 Tax=unclassified Frankia TaxID=2632575 RepID=UPI001932D67C|nr:MULTISPECIES: ABC transporter substrate-binding protein [unclassified Frankia]MBL7487946.1 ABC transporter substrate-binding protein [Frankia sp. AgW1.1]MBL7550389.1 ABC transporter substrate-binding protein [Frankia sp. AgB1.9]MBL7620859.1 ABC transporter substrate-binding protein [Frankia sp. AgB1.8]